MVCPPGLRVPCYEAERRYRRPMAASPIPASAISGPTTAQNVTPDMTLPPSKSRPCSVKTTPAIVISTPPTISRVLVIASAPLQGRAADAPLQMLPPSLRHDVTDSSVKGGPAATGVPVAGYGSRHAAVMPRNERGFT